jgi:hypothetical protein
VTWDERDPLGETVGAIYDEVGVPRSIEGWGRLFDLPEIPPPLAALAKERFEGALVISFEIAPVLERALVAQGCTVIDVVNHPVRFLDDIFFGWRCTDAAVAARLARHAVREDWVHVMAGLQSAAALRSLRLAPEPDSLLFLMQVTHDRSQLRDGRFIGAGDYVDAIAALGRQYRRVYVKEHPLQMASPGTRAVLEACPNATIIDENFYRLMAAPGIAGVASLSSSASIEAPYFGKAAHTLNRPPFRFALDGAVPDADAYVGIHDGYLSADFWRDILGDTMPVTPRDGSVIPFKPNRIRTAMRSFWGFSQIDTDVLFDEAMRSLPVPPTPIRRVVRRLRGMARRLIGMGGTGTANRP